MNVSKIIALTAIAATVLVAGYQAASAQTAAACNNQPNMMHALGSLRNAHSFLERAEHNKGGWRERASQATQQAITETERGCAFADTH